MSNKSTIISVSVNATTRTVYVTYSTGTEKMYPVDKIPKTVQQWLETHQTEPEAPEPPTEATTEPQETAREATEATEPVRYPFVLVGLPYDAVQATTEPLQAPEAAAAALPDDTEPVRVFLDAKSIITLGALGAAWIGISAGVYACEILALLALATQLITHIIGQAYHRAKVNFIALVSQTGKIVQAATQKVSRATKKAIQAGKIALMVICIRMITKARMGAVKAIQAGIGVRLWAVDAWKWREELLVAETIVG